VKAAIRRAWVLDNMQRIGPGGFYHLAYAQNQIGPEFMRWIKESSDYGKIHIYLLTDDATALDVADGEVFAIHWFPAFIRIHFMVENIRSIHDAPVHSWQTDYMLMA
jgi:hypothetical protein